jgi:hypothetical protein
VDAAPDHPESALAQGHKRKTARLDVVLSLAQHLLLLLLLLLLLPLQLPLQLRLLDLQLEPLRHPRTVGQHLTRLVRRMSVMPRVNSSSVGSA